jgi:hypothetical protein
MVRSDFATGNEFIAYGAREGQVSDSAAVEMA